MSLILSRALSKLIPGSSALSDFSIFLTQKSKILVRQASLALLME